MEILGLVDVPLYYLLALAAFVLTYIYGTWNHNYFKKRDIPGPAPYPFVGNSFDVGFQNDLYDWCQKYGSVYGIFLGRQPAYVITDLEILKEVFVKSFDNFRNRRKFPLPYPFSLALFALEDDTWKRVRNIMTPTFTGVKLRRMCGPINDCAKTLTTNFSKDRGVNHRFNMKQYFGSYAMDVIAQTAFGIKIDSQNDFNDPFVAHAKMLFAPTKLAQALATLSNVVPILEPIFINLGLGIFPRKVVTFFEKITAELIEQRRNETARRQEPRPDFLQLMMDASTEEGPGENANGETVKHSARHLSEEEIVAQCILFFIAGYDTTGSTLSYTAYNLAKNPDVQEKAYNEIKEILGNEEPNYDNIGKLKYMDNVITETLRLYPPGFVLNRVSSETIQIKGLTLSKGQSIFIPVMAIHRDPQLYEDPDSFRPERHEEQAKTISFQAFGSGPRICIGMRLALVEVKVALANVLRSVKFERLPDTPDVLTFARNPNILQTKEDIMLKVSPRC
ncbi:cytochrome P450 3A13-like [Haliotis rufescens]|uniref:cytochrome P450 3A13-like n=1 Tax=Haliotis rufescens TaxID=6454 RepID=UPI001EB0A455|nr:cytochrome P450 3A13-like [Haliotis rufescens]